MSQKSSTKELAEKFLKQQEKNRERQTKYRQRKTQMGYKQMTIFVKTDNSAPVQKLAEEWKNYQDKLPEFERIVRSLANSLVVASNNNPSPNRPILMDLANFLAKIQK